MAVTYKNDEVQAFARRLENRLRHQGKTLSPTALAREFNLRWRGAPVTVNATRKWLMGEAIPTLDKLSVLASLLDVSEDWLRWGDKSVQEPLNNAYSQAVAMARMASGAKIDKSFVQDFQLLNPVNKKLVSAVMQVLLKEQQKAISEEAPSSPRQGLMR